MTVLGIVLAILGILALVYQGFSYTHQKTVVDIGPIHATANDRDHVSIPPILGGLVLAGGIALVVLGERQRA
jgi:uncharacterized membrane protein